MMIIALAGALGTALRHGLNVWMLAAWGAFLPYGTFAANVLGSFGLGLIMESFSGFRLLGVDARLVLGTGLMGGFTTYSSFNLETFRMLQQGAWLRAFGYAGATLLSCLVAGAAGVFLVRATK